MKPSGRSPALAGDSERVRLVRAGSLDAFDSLVTSYQGRIYAYVRNRLPDRRDAEDLTQQIFVKAYRKLARYDERHSFPAWLYGIARHEVLTAVRRRKPVLSVDREAVDHATPAAELMASDDCERLWHLARGCLPERQFSALWLVYREDLPPAEAARILKVTSSHIKVMLHRGRRKLLERLGQTRQGRLALGASSVATAEISSYPSSPREVSS